MMQIESYDRQGELRTVSLFRPVTETDHLRRIRFWLVIFMAGLVVSGITTFPLQTELGWLVTGLHARWLEPVAEVTHLLPWIERVHEALSVTNAHFPFSLMVRTGLHSLILLSPWCSLALTSIQ